MEEVLLQVPFDNALGHQVSEAINNFDLMLIFFPFLPK